MAPMSVRAQTFNQKEKQMQTFYFDTGVKPGQRRIWGGPVETYGCQVVRGGTIQIPMEVDDVPKGSVFLYAKDGIGEEVPGVIHREILNNTQKGGLLSKFAFFRIPLDGKLMTECERRAAE
jgi:hypothetical protein